MKVKVVVVDRPWERWGCIGQELTLRSCAVAVQITAQLATRYAIDDPSLAKCKS